MRFMTFQRINKLIDKKTRKGPLVKLEHKAWNVFSTNTEDQFRQIKDGGKPFQFDKKLYLYVSFSYC